MLLLKNFLIWVHLLAMAGVLGGFLYGRLIFISADQSYQKIIQALLKKTQYFIGLILISGFALFYFQIQTALQGKISLGDIFKDGVTHVILTKLALLIAVGAFSGIGSKKVREENYPAAEKMWLLALVSTSIAVLLGVMLRSI